jgi:L-threonylcarbamoyladenylate synthase
VPPLLLDLRRPDARLDPLVEALLDGRTVVLPTDTVYGLACAAHLPEACERTLRLKGRGLEQPSALLAGSREGLFGAVLPDDLGAAGARARRLLPGPVTVIVPNPARRFAWLCGSDPDRIGLRVPPLDARLAAAVDRVGAILATSANRHGEPAPSTLSEVPAELRAGCAVVVDGGTCAHGVPSTVVDLTGPEPVVLREGALSEREVRARIAAPIG